MTLATGSTRSTSEERSEPCAKAASETAASGRKKRPPKQKRRLFWNVVMQAFAMFGIALLVYPEAANWVNTLGHNAEISGYISRVADTPSDDRQRILKAAYAYNDELDPGPLTDPYISQAEDEVLRSNLYQAYEEMLRISGTEAIGTLNYPRVNIQLPAYHGTTDEVISKGVGHMYGTSLPVGGPSTRAVLTAHSGLPSAKLFTPLHQSAVGDTFWISVLGEDHYYQVRSIETVEPGDTESLRIIEGEDWVTLFTCTPTGVNSHRLLVHAQRIDSPDAGSSQAIAGDGLAAGFPWWAIWFVAGSGAVGWLLFAPPRKQRGQSGQQGERRSGAHRRTAQTRTAQTRTH